MLAELVNRADVGMLERGGEACLTLEAGEPLGRSAPFPAKELDRHFPFEAQVLGAIHLAHPPFAQAVEQAIVRNDGRSHGRSAGALAPDKKML